MKFRIVQKKGEIFGAEFIFRFFARLQSWNLVVCLKLSECFLEVVKKIDPKKIFSLFDTFVIH